MRYLTENDTLKLGQKVRASRIGNVDSNGYPILENCTIIHLTDKRPFGIIARVQFDTGGYGQYSITDIADV